MQVAQTITTNQTIRINLAKQVDATGALVTPVDPSYPDPTITISDPSFGNYFVFTSLFTPSGKVGTVTIHYSSTSSDPTKKVLTGELVLTIEGQVADSLLPVPGVPTP